MSIVHSSRVFICEGLQRFEFNDRSVGTVAAVCYMVDICNSGVSVKRGFTIILY